MKNIICQLANHFCLFVLFSLSLGFVWFGLFVSLFVFLQTAQPFPWGQIKSGEAVFFPFLSKVPDLEYVTKWFEKAVRHGVVPETPIAPWCLRKGGLQSGAW